MYKCHRCRPSHLKKISTHPKTKHHNISTNVLDKNSAVDLDNDKVLYLKPTLGLCNRLLLIDSALKFVKKYNFQKLKINWSKTQGFSDEKFQTLFDIQYIDKIIEFIDDEEYNSFSNKKEILKLEDLVEQDQFTLDYHYHRSQYEIFNYIIDNTFTYSWFAPFEYIFPNMIKHDKYYPFIQSISPSALLQTQLDNFHIDKNFVGIHIRRGDSYKSQYAYQYSGSTTQSYINLLNNELKETENIFLATDCEQTQEQIIKSCPNKNIIISNKNFVDINLTEWQPKPEQFTAALDLLLLSQCSKIYGNEFSQRFLTKSQQEAQFSIWQTMELQQLSRTTTYGKSPVILVI